MQAVRFYGMGFAVSTIQPISGISRSRLLEWYRDYCQDGLTAVLDHRTGGNNRKLTDDQIADLTTKLHQDTPEAALGRRQSRRRASSGR
jgi:transposase